MKSLRNIFIAISAMIVIGIGCSPEPDSTTTTVGGDTIAPVLTVSSPSEGSTNYGSVLVAGTASDNVGFGNQGVYLYVDNQSWGLIGKTSFSTNVVLSVGAHTLAIRAFDAALNASQVTRNIVMVDQDIVGPSVVFNSIFNGSAKTNSFILSSTVNDFSGVIDVELTVNSNQTYDMALNGGVYVYTLSSNELNVGDNLLEVRAWDTYSNQGYNSLHVSYVIYNDVTAPTINITAPVNGKTNTNNVILSGTVSDDLVVAGASVQLDSRTVESLTVNAGAWTKSYTMLSAGTHSATVKAWDESGNTNTAVRSFFIIVYNDVTAPVVVITAPATDGLLFTNSITISGTVLDEYDDTIGASVKIDSGAAESLMITDKSNWTKTYSFGDLSSANHTATVMGWDSSGNTNTVTRTFDYVHDDSINPDLFISEYSHSADTGNRYVEICNPTGAQVDLLNYQVRRFNNTGAASTALDWDLGYMMQLSGYLEDGDVFVVGETGADSTIASHTDINPTPSYLLSWDGDDPVGLFKTTDGGSTWFIIDQIGVLNTNGGPNDPGSGWDVAGTATATREHVLVRKSFIMQGNTNWTESADSEWEVYDDGTYVYVGVHPGTAPDVVAPNFITKSLSDMGGTSATLSLSVDEDCAVYFVVLANNSTVPATNTIIDNPISLSGYVSHGSIAELTVAAGVSNVTLNNLTDDTEYDVYIVAQDDSGNATMNKLDLDNSSAPQNIFAVYTFDDDSGVCSTNSPSINAMTAFWMNLSNSPASMTNVFSQFSSTAVSGRVVYSSGFNKPANSKFMNIHLSWGSGTFDGSQITFYTKRSGTGPINVAIFTSADHFVNPIYMGTNLESYAQHTADITALVDITNELIIRISGYGAPSSAGTFYVDELNITGIHTP